MRADAADLRRHLVLAGAFLMLATGPASAHRLKVFATAVGASIEGEAYFAGGGPAGGVQVTLLGRGDEVLGRGTAGPDGRFRLPAPAGGNVAVVVDAQDGHVARFTVAGPAPFPATPSAPVARPVTPADAVSAPVVPLADLDVVVARRIAPLAAEIDALESTLRIRDVIGGIGYIVGIFGLLLFVKAWRREGRRP